MDAIGFLAIFILASGFGHGLILRWAIRVFPSVARHQRRAVIVIGLLILATPIARLFARTDASAVSSSLLAAGMIEVMIVLVAAIPMFLLGAAASVVPSAPPHVEAKAKDEPIVGRREAIERVGGIAMLGVSGAALGWGMARGRHAFEIEEVVVKVVGLPRALDGYTIAQVSDLHVGLFVGERELREGLSRLAEIKPDLVVATGDLVDIDPHFAPLMARALGSLKARDGVAAILGNHDYYTGARKVLAALRAAGVNTLVNSGIHLRKGDGCGFALLGVDDLSAEHSGGEGPSLDTAMAMVPPDAPRILLAHQPRFFRDAKGLVALQLSGHTHGGQINPGFRPADFFMEFVSGRYEAAGSTLWVNRGFGVAGPPSRVGAAPEVTKIVLVSA